MIFRGQSLVLPRAFYASIALLLLFFFVPIAKAQNADIYQTRTSILNQWLFDGTAVANELIEGASSSNDARDLVQLDDGRIAIFIDVTFDGADSEPLGTNN